MQKTVKTHLSESSKTDAFNVIKNTYGQRLAYYQSQHRTVGCKVTHMIGIPIIAVSIPLLFIKPKLAIQLHTLGWILQFVGHFVFEHNKPVLLETKDPLVLVAALQFCRDEWKLALEGRSLAEPTKPQASMYLNETGVLY